MRRGVCTKCGAAEVHAARGHFSWGGESAVRITTSRMVRATMVDTYICARCGFFEHYIADEEKLAEVAERWGRVESADA